jgi:hypothetical protein
LIAYVYIMFCMLIFFFFNDMLHNANYIIIAKVMIDYKCQFQQLQFLLKVDANHVNILTKYTSGHSFLVHIHLMAGPESEPIDMYVKRFI